MALPVFYKEDINSGIITLDEAASKHIVQVLRMQSGEQLQLTDGKGKLLTAEIREPHKRHCTLTPVNSQSFPAPAVKNTIAISLLKNASRFEWFLEKSIELGIDEVVPLLCSRTEKQHFRNDRMQAIAVSAMLQSQQVYLCKLHQPIAYKDFINRQKSAGNFFIAHCLQTGGKPLLRGGGQHNEILIGPEGDFTREEIEMAVAANYLPVNLGSTRLRTETAGIVAATLLQLTNPD